MKTNIFISVLAILLLTITWASASEMNYDDSLLEVEILSEVFDTFWWESIENLELMEEFLSEYESIDNYDFGNSPEFRELEEFIEESIFK